MRDKQRLWLEASTLSNVGKCDSICLRGSDLRPHRCLDKIPVNLTDDERIGMLMSKLGMKGFGVYVCLINEMYKKQCQHLTLTQIKNMKFPGVTNKTIMEVVNNYGLFTEKYDKVIYSAIDFISKGSYIQIQSDCNRIKIGLQSDSFPTHTRDDKDINIKDKRSSYRCC